METEKRRKIFSQIAFYCFYAGVVTETLLVLIDKSAFTNPIEGQIFRVTFLLFLVKLCLTKYKKREYAAIVLFGILGIVSYLATGRNEILRLVVFAAACKDIDINKCLKLVFWVTLTGCAALILLSLTGVYGTAALTGDYGRGSLETRYTLGMGHPNALQCMVWALTVLYLYLYVEKMKWYMFILLLLVNGGFFLLTDSKTGFIAAVFSICLAAVNRISKAGWIRRLTFAGGSLVLLGSVAISIMAAENAVLLYRYRWEWYWNEKVEFYRKLDALLTGRINSLVGTENFEGTAETWSLFSRPENEYYFDMGWVRLFYWYGIIPACIFIVLLLVLMFYCYKKQKMAALVMITSFSLYTLIEAHGISVYLARNYVFFLLGMYWYHILDWKREEKGR